MRFGILALAIGCGGSDEALQETSSTDPTTTSTSQVTTSEPPVAFDPGVLPDSLDLGEWHLAGYSGEIPDLVGPVISVEAEGAVGDGVANDHGVIQGAIDSAPDPAVILLPAGSYRIESPLEMRTGVVLRGEGSLLSHLVCASPDGCIEIQGSIGGDFTDIDGDVAIGSTEVTVADASQFAAGGGAEIQQDDIVVAEADWGENAPGQMVRIEAVNGDILSFTPALHLELDAGHNPQIRPIDFVEEVGIEDLHLERVDTGGETNNITVRRVADTWIRRVESDNTLKYHLSVSESLFIEIRDSWIHDAVSKGDGGMGYGASLSRHVTSSLVENNIFNELRHSMIIQIGTNGCVFAYNYSEANYSDDGWDKPHISLHGHYPFLNLFEGNIIPWAYVGDYWGDVGPGNTLFRNRALGTDRHQDLGDDRGFAYGDYHGVQFLVGNEVTGGEIYGELDEVVIHGNNEKGSIVWDPEIEGEDLPDSYYLGQRPDFFGGGDWPSIGGDQVLGEGTIPALTRWQQQDEVEQP